MKLHQKYIILLILIVSGITFCNTSDLMALQMGPSGKVQRDVLENTSTVGASGEESDDDSFETYYPVLGITFITPAGVNILFGYHFGYFGLHFSGAYWGDDLYGGQFNLSLHFYRSENALLSFSLIGGFSHIHLSEKVNEWTYMGAAVNINFYGLFIEIGLTYGDGSYGNPQVVGQVGYVHRFNN